MSKKSTLPSELAGFRGSRLVKRAKYAFAHALGRAISYDHLATALSYSLERHVERNRALAYWEFGTGSGNTLQRALQVLRDYDQPWVVLFDSFAGLPPPAGRADAHVTWSEGSFAFSREYILEIVRKSGFPLKRVELVEGFFEDSLTQQLSERLSVCPPSFCTIDVDYYSSTKTVLDFVGPLMSSGCHVYFDDLWSFDGHPDYGQLRALREFNQGHSIGHLVQNPILGGRIYSYYKHDYEFADEV